MPPEEGKRNGPAQVAWYASKANKSTTLTEGLVFIFYLIKRDIGKGA
jgi:hypothetical protein